MQQLAPISPHACLLAIETSCDDSSAAILQNGKVLANVVSSQTRHSAHGGVVPELASRLHLANLPTVVELALEQAGIGFGQLDALAVTGGPGLIGALQVGLNYTKGLAFALNIPWVAVDHLQGHLAALWLQEPQPPLPLMVLTASGGHTQINLVESLSHSRLLGRTLDDAAGEAFDKAAKMLGLGYPGGPHIDRLAQTGSPGSHPLPRSSVQGFDFSFSGLKTAFLYYLRKQQAENEDFIAQELNNLCASFQHRVVHELAEKLVLAAEKYGLKDVGVTGGVSANSALRALLAERCRTQGLNLWLPPLTYTTDNAAMIGLAGEQMLATGASSTWTQEAWLSERHSF